MRISESDARYVIIGVIQLPSMINRWLFTLTQNNFEIAWNEGNVSTHARNDHMFKLLTQLLTLRTIRLITQFLSNLVQLRKNA